MTFQDRIAQYEDIIANNAEAFGVPERLIKAVIFTESSGFMNQDSGDSVGLMQINITTVARLGYKGTRENLFDPKVNIYYGTMILSEGYRKYRSQGLDYVYAYYNDGRAVKNQDGNFVNSKGDTIVQAHVDNFLKKYSLV